MANYAAVVVIAGNSGAGKSTLYHNLLDTDTLEPLSPESVTKYVSTPKNIPTESESEDSTPRLAIIDTPGFEGDYENKKMQLKKLSAYTEGEANGLLYCIAVGPGDRFNDSENMKCLQEGYGDKIWEHCVVVFTKSNLLLHTIQLRHKRQRKCQCQDSSICEFCVIEFKEVLRKYAKEFEQQLKKLDVQQEVKTIFDSPSQNVIIAVPAGFQAEHCVLPGLDWKFNILLEISKKGVGQKLLQYQYLKMPKNQTPKNSSTAESLKEVAVVGGALVGGTAGVVAGGSVGGGAGFYAGALLGAAVTAVEIGVAAGGVTVGVVITGPILIPLTATVGGVVGLATGAAGGGLFGGGVGRLVTGAAGEMVHSAAKAVQEYKTNQKLAEAKSQAEQERLKVNKIVEEEKRKRDDPN